MLNVKKINIDRTSNAATCTLYKLNIAPMLLCADRQIMGVLQHIKQNVNCD